MTIPFTTLRLALAATSLIVLAPAPPVYPGATRDTPQSMVEKSTGLETSATYVTADAFEKVDSFYRAHGAEDTGARRVSAASKRALLFRGLEERRARALAEEQLERSNVDRDF